MKLAVTPLVLAPFAPFRAPCRQSAPRRGPRHGDPRGCTSSRARGWRPHWDFNIVQGTLSQIHNLSQIILYIYIYIIWVYDEGAPSRGRPKEILLVRRPWRGRGARRPPPSARGAGSAAGCRRCAAATPPASPCPPQICVCVFIHKYVYIYIYIYI